MRHVVVRSQGRARQKGNPQWTRQLWWIPRGKWDYIELNMFLFSGRWSKGWNGHPLGPLGTKNSVSADVGKPNHCI